MERFARFLLRFRLPRLLLLALFTLFLGVHATRRRVATDFSRMVPQKQDGICKDHEVLKVIEDYEEEVGSIPGVTVVIFGLLLGFLFIMNMIGAVILLPWLIYVFDARTERSPSS